MENCFPDEKVRYHVEEELAREEAWWLTKCAHGEFPEGYANARIEAVGKLLDAHAKGNLEAVCTLDSLERYCALLRHTASSLLESERAACGLSDRQEDGLVRAMILSPRRLTDVAEQSIFIHTGWRKISGAWAYLHGDGALGANGPIQDISVSLTQALGKYRIILPENANDLRGAVQASLRILQLAPDRVSFPTLAACYRAVLGATDFSLFLHGETGGFKSELAALIQQHFGREMDAKHFPANFLSSANFVEMLAFLGKDTIFVVDDFAPKGTAQEIAQMHAIANRLFRAVGNGQGRGRMRSDGFSLREQKAPRALMLVTGEEIPRVQSVRARLLILELAKGEIKSEILTQRQAEAAAGLYAKAMAGFVMFVAADYDSIQERLRKRALELRTCGLIHSSHARTPSTIGELQAGFEIFLEFAEGVGAIDSRKRAELEHCNWEALLEAGKAQSSHQESSERAHRFVQLLPAAISGARAHVACQQNGGEPLNPERWGWRREGPPDTSRWVAKGKHIGWISGADLYLEPDNSLAVANELAKDTGDPLAITGTTLHKRLKEQGFLASTDKKRGTLSIRRVVQGGSKPVLHLLSNTLSNVGFSEDNVGSMSGSETETDISSTSTINRLEGNVGNVGSKYKWREPGRCEAVQRTGGNRNMSTANNLLETLSRSGVGVSVKEDKLVPEPERHTTLIDAGDLTNISQSRRCSP